MLRHQAWLKPSFFYFNDLVEYLPVKVRKRAFNIRHVSRQDVNTKLHNGSFLCEDLRCSRQDYCTKDVFRLRKRWPTIEARLSHELFPLLSDNPARRAEAQIRASAALLPSRRSSNEFRTSFLS